MKHSIRRGISAALVCAMLAAAPALAQKSGRDGIYGGYVGSSRQLQLETDSVLQRAAVQRALQGAAAEQGQGTGMVVDINISSAVGQRLTNLQWVYLEPQDDRTHSASALAVRDREKNEINALFIAKKDVKPGSYRVVLHDAAGNKYPIGQVRVEQSDRPQRFSIAAPRLGAAPPPGRADSAGAARADSGSAARPAAPVGGIQTGPGHTAVQAGPGYTPIQVGPGHTPIQTGPGFVAPQAGGGYVRPQTR